MKRKQRVKEVGEQVHEVIRQEAEKAKYQLLQNDALFTVDTAGTSRKRRYKTDDPSVWSKKKFKAKKGTYEQKMIEKAKKQVCFVF